MHINQLLLYSSCMASPVDKLIWVSIFRIIEREIRMDMMNLALKDPMFEKPYVDLDEQRDQPVRHRYIHGGFEGTDTRFSFYFPPAEQYQGRFFQHITPVPISENLAQSRSGEDDKISFTIASGGYFVESNGGGMSAMPPASDARITAYLANAAVARYSRVAAAQIYGQHRPFGYAYGGSGGAFRTIGGMENTSGVWDGAVPYVVGSPMAIPNVFTVRMLAMRVLWDKFPAILDAVEPGGSGDMYAGLNAEEHAALREVTRMGFPPRGWFNYKTLGMGALSVLFEGIAAMDPTYFNDFWTLPGYAGVNPDDSLRRARVQHKTTIIKVVTREEALRMGWDIEPQVAFGASRGGVDDAWQQ
ncbi:MAG: hypothetical protein IH586_11420, partial [Anaerolineaceae bacterium]|nr:hypothetical protein [Anaerolineaceae bacterium]